MSRNYHIQQPETGTGDETARDRLAFISGLLATSQKPTDKNRGRNALTRTLDTAFALVRKYLPPLHWLFAAMTASLLFLYMQLVVVTARLISTCSQDWPQVPTPSVLALWHGDAPSLLVAFAKRRPHVKTIIMIARDPRGDSEKGGWDALLQLADELMDGACVIITADGGGPAREAKVGAVALASAAGVPLIPLAANCYPAIEEHHKWDKARNPLPFSSITISIGPPRTFDFVEDASSVEEARAWLEKTLNTLQVQSG